MHLLNVCCVAQRVRFVSLLSTSPLTLSMRRGRSKHKHLLVQLFLFRFNLSFYLERLLPFLQSSPCLLSYSLLPCHPGIRFISIFLLPLEKVAKPDEAEGPLNCSLKFCCKSSDRLLSFPKAQSTDASCVSRTREKPAIATRPKDRSHLT